MTQNIFSHSVGSLFILLMVSFPVQELFKLGCLLPVEFLRVLRIFWIYKDIPLYTFIRYACVFSHFSRVQLFATLWTVAHPAPLSLGILQLRILDWVATPPSRGSSLSRKIPHAWKQLSQCATTTEPVRLKPVLSNKPLQWEARALQQRAALALSN